MTADTLTPSMAVPTEPDTAAQTAAQTNPTDVTPTSTAPNFADLGVHPRVVATLSRMGIETPTLIQSRAIPALLEGRDVVGQSRTGSGKTIAYGLPLIERIDPRLRRMQALVLVPTRELAGQVASVLFSLGAGRGLRVAQLIGGRSYLPQREALRMGAQIAVGAPGRVLDHLRQGTLDLSHLTIAVLDEADQMLDAGFAPDVERLLSAMPETRQLALFTATLPEMTTEIANRYLREPVSVDAGTPESRPAPTITQTVYTVPREHRLAALMALLDRRRDASGTTLVFGRTKHGVDKLARQLIARGYPVAALHGNMSQNARDRVLSDFRNGRSPVLLATNVAARGLDVLSIEQVINYELPETAELFTHRVGRTGRMDNTGEAITLLSPDDMAQWRRFSRDLAMKVRPQPWPLGELSVPAPIAPPAQPAAENAATANVTQAPEQVERFEPERRFERRNDHRFEHRGERGGERRPERRFEHRNDHRFERRERGFRHDFERGEAPTITRDERVNRSEDVASRWTRKPSEFERRDDYGNGRAESRPERRDTDRFERRDSGRREFRREDRFEGRPEGRPEGRFTGEREFRREGREGRDNRRGDDRAPRPFRAEGGPRHSAGGRPSSRPGGRPSGRPSGRPMRERSHRPTRG